MIERATENDVARFWSKVGRGDGCWRWLAGKTRNGYGVMGFGGHQKIVYGHRFSWELHNGPLPPGAHVLHSCDNPQCVNPGHLRIGTPADNSRDCVGRARHARGARNGHAVLNDTVVAEMRRLRREAGLSYGVIADRFGVSDNAARRACVGLDWRHVSEPTAPSVFRSPASYALQRQRTAR